MITVQNFSNDPFYNQAFEEYIFQTVREEDVFLLWQNKPAVIVGSYQNICREVHVETLRRMGIPVIRRISGGGTVYHDMGNINYTIMTRQDGPVNYERCMQPMIEALNNIGISARKNRTCDIAIGEQKISGSAQRIANGRILHHGTLLFESDLSVLDRITTQHKNDCFKSKGTVSAICSVTNIREHLTVPMSLAEFKERLLEEILPQGSSILRLTPEQEEEVCRLRDEKYHSWEWTWGKTPAFVYEKKGIFAGVPIHIEYKAKRGIIYEAHIECAAVDGNEASRLMNGTRLDPEGLADICRILVGEQTEELMNWLL